LSDRQGIAAEGNEIMVRLRRIPAVRAASLLTLTIGIPYGVVSLIFAVLFVPFYVTSTGGGLAESTQVVGFQTMSSIFLAWAFAMATIWISIVIACGLYNLIAGRFGGIELEFTTMPPPDL